MSKQKTKIRLNYNEIVANFTNFDSVSLSKFATFSAEFRFRIATKMGTTRFSKSNSKTIFFLHFLLNFCGKNYKEVFWRIFVISEKRRLSKSAAMRQKMQKLTKLPSFAERNNPIIWEYFFLGRTVNLRWILPTHPSPYPRYCNEGKIS